MSVYTLVAVWQGLDESEDLIMGVFTSFEKALGYARVVKSEKPLSNYVLYIKCLKLDEPCIGSSCMYVDEYSCTSTPIMVISKDGTRDITHDG